MKKLTLALTLIMLSSHSLADCYGGSTFYSCYGNNGNSYNIQKIGNTTYMDGYNSRTGSRWSQESTTYGNTTYTDGRSANGNSWNMTTQRLGNTTYIDGRDSRGNYFSKICNQFGCY